MIMDNIEKINVTPGIWAKLWKNHWKINEEITVTHENETKGPDLSIATLKKERFKYRSNQNSAKTSANGRAQLFSQTFGRRPGTMSRDQLSGRIKKEKWFFKEKKDQL